MAPIVLMCASSSDVSAHIRGLVPILTTVETEDNWDKISTGIASLMNLCTSGGACDFPETLIPALKPIAEAVNNAMKSERSRLSGVAMDFVCALANGLGESFEQVLSSFIPTILLLCSRASKVTSSRARATLLTVISSTHSPLILPYLTSSAKDKSVTLRLCAAEGVLTALRCFNPPDLEKENRAKDVEGVIRSAGRDANADVRKMGRAVWEAYKEVLPGRVESFTAPLTPTIKKYLNIAATKSQPTLAKSTSSSLHHSTSSRSKDALAVSTSSKLSNSTKHSSTKSTKGKEPVLSSQSTRRDPVSHSSKAMPPPTIVPVRPLPSKTSSSSLAVSKASVKPAVRPPKPEIIVAVKLARPEGGAQRVPLPLNLAFPSAEEERVDEDNGGMSQSTSTAPVRGPPGHQRTRSLFGRTKPELPQLQKKPDPKPTGTGFKPARQNTVSTTARSVAQSTGAVATKPVVAKPATSAKLAGLPKSTAVSSKAPAKGFAPKKTETLTKRPEASASKSNAPPTKPSLVKKPSTLVKPTWGGGGARATSASKVGAPTQKKIATKPPIPSRPVSSTSRPNSVTIPSRPASAASRLDRLANGVGLPVPLEVAQAIPLPPSPGTVSTLVSGAEQPNTAAEVEQSDVELTVVASMGSEVETSEIGSGVEEALFEFQEQISSPSSSRPLSACSSSHDDQDSVSTPTADLEIHIDAATPQPTPHTLRTVSSVPANLHLGESTPPPAIKERILWETKQLEKTPISSLLSSIEQGFLFTPASPLSPPLGYLNRSVPEGRRGLDLGRDMLFPLNFNRVDGEGKEGSKEGTFMFGTGNLMGEAQRGENVDISLL